MTPKELIERIERGEKWTGLEGHLEGLAEAHSKILKENETLRQQLAEAQALIEASRKQKPAAFKGKNYGNLHHHDFGNSIPLFAAPVVADDVLKDAQRYRWLRESDSDEACVMAYIEGLDEWVAYDSAESVDMAIDAAIGGVA